MTTIPDILQGIILSDRQREALIDVRDRHFTRLAEIRNALANEEAPRAEPKAVAQCWRDLPVEDRRTLVGTDPQVRRERSAMLQEVREILTPRQRARFNVNARRWTSSHDERLAARRAHAHC
ncbi:MAG: hypothetical protein NVS9B3_13180 [Gemmatimonadaceae bacterium]